MDDKNITYWRSVVAAAAKIRRELVTQFTPGDFAAWLGQSEWWRVYIEDLALTHSDRWVFTSKYDSLEERQEYAFRTRDEAYTHLVRNVAPAVPAAGDE